MTPIALALLLLTQEPAQPSRSLECPPRWGAPGVPLVTMPETATAIFLAIEADFYPADDRMAGTEVFAEDQGDSWAVIRVKLPEERPDGSVLMQITRRQLSLRVAKCDGAVSDISRYQR